MVRFLAVLGLVSCAAGAAQACNIVTFDYDSFSRPPMKVNLERYLAGTEDVDYLSVGLGGITLQISHANWEVATGFRGIWEAWVQTGEVHPMARNFQDYFVRPDRIETAFGAAEGVGLVGYRSVIMEKYRPKSNPDFENTILFALVEDAKGSGAVSLYLNDPTGQGDMAAVMAEYAGLLEIEPACVSETGAYEGQYLPQAAQYVVFPVEAFSDND